MPSWNLSRSMQVPFAQCISETLHGSWSVNKIKQVSYSHSPQYKIVNDFITCIQWHFIFIFLFSKFRSIHQLVLFHYVPKITSSKIVSAHSLSIVVKF